MKTIDYYLNLPYKFEIIPDHEEGGFIIRYPDLPGCISVAEKADDIIANANEAKRAWLEAAIEMR